MSVARGGRSGAARLVPRARMLHALIVSLIFTAVGATHLVALPHPLWFWFPGVAVFLPAARAGAKLAAPGTEGGAR